MSTLIVLLPPREPAVPLQEWQWPELPFALVDKSGHTQRAGRAALALLPQAATTVLIVAARDLLMLEQALPPLKGPRLKQALPNIIEDQLIQDPQGCHIAVDPAALDGGRRVLAVIDRAWFKFIVDAFTAAGHRHLRAVPVTRCLPPATRRDAAAAAETEAVADVALDRPAEHAAAADAPGSGHAGATANAPAPAESIVAVALGLAATERAPSLAEEPAALLPQAPSAPRVELALARGALGEGFAAPVSSAVATLEALANGTPLELYELGEPGAEPQLASVRPLDDKRLLPGAAIWPFDALVRRALDSRFDLCQFEFEFAPWRFDRATFMRLRLPLALAATTLAIAVIGANAHWWKLSRERDALAAQITETLLSTFPKTTTVLDPAAQMTRQLDRLRIAAGELSPNDFLSLASGLARSLGPLPPNGIASLDYHDRRLDVGFKPETKVDPDFAQRLARNGLTGEIDSSTGKWTIRSRS
ncbi:type II secretion system protein L [Burkholderia pseudomallei]|uniref:type II secretion system protein GspL n=15 Tax=Burkholderia pseudomallei TaxID=28450 RepID=UPI000173690C|nr:type II secretion system protein GspL [Burkholderia pseudomallei]AHE27584.1 type II secretion system protein L [Burkholderia pseudomallei NCTC 13178]AHE33667.1 type II secretion system protein L [Burkholderia pseudomallei NAU20B-16]AHG68961.1 type II secretion system protein L [Burkholderia pseudomallei MSHR146]AIO15088.1 type II secretion system protein L [Burkholderia pseudomallei]AIO85073.1 type II secretion system protein L [Burkholderia pseudomallei]